VGSGVAEGDGEGVEVIASVGVGDGVGVPHPDKSTRMKIRLMEKRKHFLSFIIFLPKPYKTGDYFPQVMVYL
jgi:hypothetical protein